MTTHLKRLAVVICALVLTAGGLSLAPPKPRHSGLELASSTDAVKAELERFRQKVLGYSVGENPRTEPDAPGPDWIINQRTGKDGTVSLHDFKRALSQSQDAEQRTLTEAPEIAAADWALMGPTNIGGRVADVAVDPTVADTVYTATAGGGVWKSTDAGMNWTFSWPDDVTQTMGALAVGSDGVLYAGTGESNPGGGSITYGGTGLYRSTDHGETWELSGLKASGAFGRIAVDPSDPSRVFAAASGNLYRPGGERGLYLSEDGGDSWRRVLEGENDTTGAADIAIDPVNPDNILVGMWDRHRLPSHRIYTGVGSGVWRSSDGGETWTEVVLPHGLAAENVGRIGVAFAPSDPNRAYAIVANNQIGEGVGLFRSDDGGASFTKTAVAGTSLSQSSFGWWFGRLWVDPDEPQKFYIPGVNLLRSTNGGDTVANGGGNVHADQHAMAWDPNVPGRVYLGNDGGMYRSDNDGQAWTRANDQGWTQHYSVDVGELTPSRIVTGLQDNGCIRNWSGDTNGGVDGWSSYGCGDGLETLINPQHERTFYGCSQYGGCSVSLEGAPLGAPMTFPATPANRKGWWTPIIFDPTNSLTMYWGASNIARSPNGGVTWVSISPDLTKNETQLDQHSGYKIRHVITALAASKSNLDTFWAGTDDGLLWKTSNLTHPQPTWTKVESPALPDGAWITRVTIDPANHNVVYVTYSGYRAGDDSARVMKTADGGVTWTNISSDLPAAPVNDLLVVGDRLIVASDVGVFVSDDGGAHWFKLGSNLPMIPVIEMRYHQGTNTLTIATFGHGIQRVTLP